MKVDLKKLINLGTTENQSLGEQKRVRLLNQILSLGVLFVLIRFFIGLHLNDEKALFITPFLLSIFGTSFYLHYKQKQNLARDIFLSFLSVGVAILGIMFGRGFGAEFLFISVSLFISIFYNTFGQKLKAFILLAIVYSIMLFSNLKFGALVQLEVTTADYYLMFVINFLIVFLMTVLFTTENRSFERKMQEMVLEKEKSNQELQEVNQELERFAFVASHDLKTPLRNINSFLGLIERKLPKDTEEEIKEFLNIARLNAKRMHALIENVLEYSKIDKKDVVLERHPLDEIIQASLFNLHDLLKEKNARITSYGEMPNVFCNKMQLITVFQNLIENGIKYNEHQLPQIIISFVEKEFTFEILISDNGIGIDESFQTRVFEMFYRLHNQEKYKGTGIGLAICQKILAINGGKLYISSSGKDGTTFNLVLPKFIETRQRPVKEKAVLV